MKANVSLHSTRLQLTKVTRYEYINTAELISLIGGAFGVLIGFSMIFVVELFFFLFIFPSRMPLSQYRHIRWSKYYGKRSHNTKYQRYTRIYQNEIFFIRTYTQTTILRLIFNHSFGIKKQLVLMLTTIMLVLLSVWFVRVIWMRSYSDPMIVTISNTKTSTSNVS